MDRFSTNVFLHLKYTLITLSLTNKEDKSVVGIRRSSQISSKVLQATYLPLR